MLQDATDWRWGYGSTTSVRVAGTSSCIESTPAPMPDHDAVVTDPTPSAVLECFVHAVERDFPEDEKKKLDGYADAVQETTAAHDGHRARHCAAWAIHHAAQRDQSHPRWNHLRALHEVWKEAWFGIEFGVGDEETRVVGRPEPLEDVWIEWTEGAVAVARTIGEEEGWANAGWEGLLTELIAIGKT
jgi:hypothetical protein